ncbi:MAG: DUF262 domain-containing protein [Candidatus Magnetoovum sp. WYHC-5]|nr:DUF262 domain-containing protein [Candidatus Magnetoovum sp. WYHC-5]
MSNTEVDVTIKEEVADGSPTGVEEKSEENTREEPFDPTQISIDVKLIIVDSIIRRLLNNSIRLAPAFQRNEVWNIERKSRLIESLMLKIPIPMFYVSSDQKGNYDVVDGLQRLSTIRDFVLGEDYIKTKDESKRGKGFQLKGLEFWGEKYNNKTFNELPPEFKDRILETEFRFTVINPGTPEEVKRNIFKRVNTGGMPLTAQEIRHALYQGEATKLLEELAKSEVFNIATGEAVDDSRMAARELVLRFLSFSLFNYKDYPKSSDMDAFMSNAMRVINLMPDIKIEELKKIFKDSDKDPYVPLLRYTDVDSLKKRFFIGMKRANELFGKLAFRRHSKSGRMNPLNKTLFEAWGNVLADLDEDSYKRLIKNKDILDNTYTKKAEELTFNNSFSRYNAKYTDVQYRYKVLKECLTNAIGIDGGRNVNNP